MTYGLRNRCSTTKLCWQIFLINLLIKIYQRKSINAILKTQKASNYKQLEA